MSMFVALDSNRQLITIDNAHRGLACDCICVSCSEPVVARKGLIREHHFSHHSNKESCFIHRESLLHLYAKEVICSNFGLQLPPMPGTYPASEDPTSWWDFERIEPEVRQSGFQPDLVAHLKDNTQLFIEVAVTSFIGEEKLNRIKTAGTKTIELDLSDLLCSNLPIPSEAVKEQILRQTQRITWIYPEPQYALLPTPAPSQTPPVSEVEPRRKCPEQRFTIMSMWVIARTLPTGSIAVHSWSFNPQITELLKSWRNELGGEYNPKYRNWIFYPQYHEEVLNRLQRLDE